MNIEGNFIRKTFSGLNVPGVFESHGVEGDLGDHPTVWYDEGHRPEQQLQVVGEGMRRVAVGIHGDESEGKEKEEDRVLILNIFINYWKLIYRTSGFKEIPWLFCALFASHSQQIPQGKLICILQKF